jgi:CMP-N,N'-diacetyllegionaminic acid synthase
VNELIAFIPARSGSKRLPKKNVLKLGSQTLLERTINVARSSHVFDRIFVSTDSEEIAREAQSAGAEVPILRSSTLATDASPVIDAVAELLDWLEREEKYCPSAVMLLQPTSPFRTERTIKQAVELFAKHNKKSVISVSEAFTHPSLCRSVDANGKLREFSGIQMSTGRKQDLPNAFQLNGLIYLACTETIRESSSFYSDDTYALVIADEVEVIDIDTDYDFYIAQLIAADKGI